MSASRRGWSALELLVVVAVIGVLASLLLVAVQRARESARDLQCKNNLKQIGVALQSYHATHHQFPSLAYADAVALVEGRESVVTERFTSPFAHLLVYLDRSDAADLADLTPSGNVLNDVSGPNQRTKQIVVPTFLCPSDSQSFPFQANSNYRFCTGASPKVGSDLRKPESGAFGFFISRKLGEFQDGASKTALVSERVLGGGAPTSFDPSRDFWYTSMSTSSDFTTPSADLMLTRCSSSSVGAVHYPWMGYSWFNGGYENTWYNHVAGPNAAVSDCSVDPGPVGQPTQAGSFASRSRHAHVNVLLADGSVDAFSPSISLGVWRSLATVSGND
jgi:prepilin-type N-terminal cleavage/methylation domain-containing protein